MNIMQRIRSALQRPLSYFGSLFKEREEVIPLEHDPVGEFLENKEKGVNLADEGVAEGTPLAEAAPQPSGQTIKASDENVAGAGKVEEAATQATEAQLGSVAQLEAKVETAAALVDGEQKETDKAEAEASAVLSESKLEAKTPEPDGQKVEAANTQPANSPQEENKIESVLDVFRSEKLAVDTTVSLSKELNDMNVYSLLEETKQIAQITKKAKKASQE